MKIEHIAFVVEDPDVVAKWYCDHMGMRLVRQGPPPVKMTFLADSSGQTMFEVYKQPSITTTDYFSVHHLALHFAFYTDEIDTDFQKLISAGASVIQDPYQTDAGDTLAMLRDPWGVSIQLVKRKQKMM